MRALHYAGGSSILGAAYFWYLRAVPFPTDAARAVPLVWLAVAAYGTWLAALDVTRGKGLGLSGLALVFGVPSFLFAALFSVAAVMGG